MRYATYPTSDWFVEAIGSTEVSDWLIASEALDPVHPPSLDVRIPQLACATIAPHTWLEALGHETGFYAQRLTCDRAVAEVHWTLGSVPMPDEWLAMLLDILASSFYLGVNSKLVALVDPMACDMLPFLAEMGFSHIDIGSARADPDDRRELRTRASYTAADRHKWMLEGAKSISGDPRVSVGFGLCYGAPDQTIDDLARQMDQTLACGPQRILVQDMTPRRRNALDRPGEGAIAEIEQPMLKLVAERLAQAGYARVAKDYYALRGDAFGAAQRHGRLVTRPYGPSTAAGLTTVALGPGAIGAVGPVYYQNHLSGEDYVAALRQRRFPVMRGICLDADDLLRRAVVHSLSSNFFVDVEALSLAHCVDFYRHFSAERPMLDALEHAGLITRTADAIEVVGDGLLQVDNICTVFDAYLRRHRSSKPYTTQL